MSPSERLLKRILDVTFSALLLIALSPVILLVAILVALRDGRPIFYSDRRAGLFGRPISIRKFRTMRVGADRERAEMWAQSETSGPAFKIAADPASLRSVESYENSASMNSLSYGTFYVGASVWSDRAPRVWTS